MRILLSSTALTVLLGALPAHAQEAATEVETLTIEAARLPTTPADAPGVRVVDEAEIEALQAQTAADVLTTVPGVSLYSEGAFGGITSVRLRGASTDKTLVLLDGVPMNDPSTPSGAFNFSSIDVADIDRVEVLSGPQGSLWGSSAIGGVIAFRTREADGLAAAIEAGSFASVRGWTSIGRSETDYALSATVSAFRTDGVSQADEANGNVEDDGFETWTAGLNGRVRVAPAIEFDGRVRYTRTNAETDGFPPPLFLLSDTADRAESATWSGYGRASIDGPWGVDHAFSVSLYDLERESFGSFPGAFTAERQVWRYVAEHDRTGDRFGFVGGIEHERVRGDASFADATLRTTSVFGVGRFDPIDRVTLTLGLRRDDPKGFDGETTVRVAAAADLGAGFRATASWGQGFKTPTISQILCDFCFAAPVPLRPETAEGWDLTLGWRGVDGRVRVSVTGYRLEVRDQIAYVAGRYENISATSAEGVEADLEAQLFHGLRLKVGYAFTDAVDEATGLRLLRAPEHAGSASLFWERGRFDAALTVRAESEQVDVVGFGTGTRPGFARADLAVGYALTERVKLTARIENLADRRYQEAAGYGEPGLSAYAGVRLRY